MKVKKIQKRLNKVAKSLWADGYARIDEVVINVDPDGLNIVVSGAYGVQDSDGKVAFQKDFELYYPDGTKLDFICGMFYQLATEADTKE